MHDFGLAAHVCVSAYACVCVYTLWPYLKNVEYLFHPFRAFVRAQ